MVGIGDEADVRALEGAYDEAWTAGDLNRLMECFSPDAVILTPYGDVLNGPIEIRESLRTVMSQPSRNTHTSKVTAVHFVANTVAVVDGEAVLNAGGPMVDKENQQLRHCFTDVLVKRDGTWRIAHVRAYAFIG